MKKFILALDFAILSCGVLFAQITVNATDGINLGNVLKVTDNHIKVSKKISSDGSLTFSPAGNVICDFEGTVF